MKFLPPEGKFSYSLTTFTLCFVMDTHTSNFDVVPTFHHLGAEVIDVGTLHCGRALLGDAVNDLHFLHVLHCIPKMILPLAMCTLSSTMIPCVSSMLFADGMLQSSSKMVFFCASSSGSNHKLSCLQASKRFFFATMLTTLCASPVVKFSKTR